MSAASLQAACSGEPAAAGASTDRGGITRINHAWSIDTAPPGQPSPRLYLESNGKRVILDRQILGYTVARSCLVYEAERSTGAAAFAASAGRVPVMIAASDPARPWHFDQDAPRRYAPGFDASSNRTVEMEEYATRRSGCDRLSWPLEHANIRHAHVRSVHGRERDSAGPPAARRRLLHRLPGSAS